MADDFGLEGLVIPDVPEPLVGWREWDAHWDTASPELRLERWPWPVGPLSRLASGFSAETWHPGRPMRAQCPFHAGSSSPALPFAGGVGWRTSTLSWPWRPHDIDRPCGHTPSATAEGHHGFGCGIYSYKTADRYHLAGGSLSRVVGRVAVYGEVWEHALGFRSELAEVTGIMVPPMFARSVPTLPSTRAVADYLAGLVMLALTYRVPVIVPLPRFDPRYEQTREFLCNAFGVPSAVVAAPNEGNMAVDLLDCEPAAAFELMRVGWGYRPSSPLERVTAADRADRELAQRLAAMTQTEITPEALEALREEFGMGGDDDG
jgi:hypothetical protein